MSKHHSETSAPPIDYCPTCGQPIRRRIPIGDDDEDDTSSPFQTFLPPRQTMPQQFQQQRPKGQQQKKWKGSRTRHQGRSTVQGVVFIILAIVVIILILASQQ